RHPNPTLYPYTTLFRSNSRKNGYEKTCVLPCGKKPVLPDAWALPNKTSCCGWRTGRLRSKMAFNRLKIAVLAPMPSASISTATRSEEHTSELQSRGHLV